MNGNFPQPPGSLIKITLFGRTFVISRFTLLMVMGGIVGAATALVTVVFRLSAIRGEQLLFPFYGEPGRFRLFSLAALQRLCMPAVGGLICGFLIFKIGKYKGTHGIPAILRSMAMGQSFFKLRMAIPSALATITLATGGSAGPEGPIAEIGSITGSVLGRSIGVPQKLNKTLIGAGVAAGIAAVFNAPVAGIFFAVEVILRNYEVASFTPIAIASVVASVITHAFLGDKMAVNMGDLHVLRPEHELLFFAFFGLLCGLASIVYVRGLSLCHRGIGKLAIPLWLKPALGGLAVGLIGLFLPQIMGEGYEWISNVIAHPPGIVLLLLLLSFKILATGITLGSGNPGGSFAPAVFVGVMGGAAFGAFTTRMGWTDSAQPYAVMGMAGLISGAMGAPITAIMITLRNTAYRTDILLPLMTTVALCVYVVQRWRLGSVYTHDMLRSGLDLDRARQTDPLSLIKVSSINLVNNFEELPGSMKVCEALERCKRSLSRWFLVRDAHGEFAGILAFHEMRMAIAEEHLGQLLVVADLIDTSIPHLHPELSLREALAEFSNCDADVLPVFNSPDSKATFLGVISRQDVLNAYHEFTELA